MRGMVKVYKDQIEDKANMKLEAGSTGSQTTKSRSTAIINLKADFDPDSVLRSSVIPTLSIADDDPSLIQAPMDVVPIVSL